MARRRDHNTDSPFTDALSQINGYKTLKPPKYISITSYRGHNMIFQVCSEFCSLFLLLAFPSVLVSAWSYLFLPRTLWSPAFWSRPFGTAAPTLLHINYCLCPARQCNMDWRLQTADWRPCQVQGFIKKKKRRPRQWLSGPAHAGRRADPSLRDAGECRNPPPDAPQINSDASPRIMDSLTIFR